MTIVLWRNTRERIAATRESIPGVFVWLLATPLGNCAALAVGALLPPMIAGKLGAIAAFDAMMAFALLNPLTCAVASRWWLHVAFSLVVWVGVFAMLGNTPGVMRLGDGSMIFVLPFMIYPVALLVSGVVRFVLWRRARRTPEPACSA